MSKTDNCIAILGASGQAILAIAPAKSDIVDLIKEHDCGWWVEPGDVKGLERVLKEISGNTRKLMQKRQNAQMTGRKFFSIEVLAKKWTAVFEEVIHGCPIK
jgi:glycosyltransferase involved in cell wall biosynthesis